MKGWCPEGGGGGSGGEHVYLWQFLLMNAKQHTTVKSTSIKINTFILKKCEHIILRNLCPVSMQNPLAPFNRGITIRTISTPQVTPLHWYSWSTWKPVDRGLQSPFLLFKGALQSGREHCDTRHFRMILKFNSSQENSNHV